MALVPATTTSVPIVLALGGGGARGLAHIVALETFDDLGIKPTRIAGTSAGALFGAAYAAGLSGKQIRAHTEEMLGQRFDLIRQIFHARTQPVAKILGLFSARNALLEPLALLEAILPSQVPKTFDALFIPLTTVACDFYAQAQVLDTDGDLRQAIAASMALPVLFAPVMRDGRALVDGGFVNPLPFDVLTSENRAISVAIDVSGGAPDSSTLPALADAVRPQPSATDVMAASSQILQRSIVREKLRHTQPDILIDCPVDAFTVIDFYRFRDVLAAAQPIKEQLKRRLDRMLSSESIQTLPDRQK